MIKLIGTYEIPDWAISYLANGDSEGLSEEEINEADEFIDNLCAKFTAKYVDFDFSVMDEDKYGCAYFDDVNLSPAFGERFGATPTWRLPVYADVAYEPKAKFRIVVLGTNSDNKFEVNTFDNMLFADVDDAELWCEAYFQHLNNIDYYVTLKSDTVFNFHK